MENTLLNMALACLEGLGLIASPCILPILPIILSGSLSGNKRRPLGIITGFIVIFALFTFFSRKLVMVLGLDSNVLRNIACLILALLGLIMLIPALGNQFGRLTQRFANVGASSSVNNPESGFGSGFLFGGLVALIWTPCAGPILAAVIVQTVIQKTTFHSFLILISFAIGAGIPMLLIAAFGRAILTNVSFIKQHAERLRQVLGAIILLSVAWMYFGNGTPASTFHTSNGGRDVEQMALIGGLSKPYPAPEIGGITAWINSPALTLSELKGKVVLIDFWTYSCINCIRSLPYPKDWYAKYHDKGFEIIGVHTPEFDFEKSVTNVKNAVASDGILYPVALDNNYITWQNFHNQYWPAQYLINKEGEVVYQHFGEGEDDVMENNIRFLLGLNIITNKTAIPATFPEYTPHQTPETYFGYTRAANYASPQNITENIKADYTFPSALHTHAWALQGKWTVTADNIIAGGRDASLKIHFHAKQVYVVMGTDNNRTIPVKILLNGNPVVQYAGKQVTDSTVTVSAHQLYSLLDFDKPEDGVLELVSPFDGLEIYTFTFGNK
jgi:cytochrome c biogenesis protein CcdA/thiol-disulfide isomerase/thioredoxin